MIQENARVVKFYDLLLLRIVFASNVREQASAVFHIMFFCAIMKNLLEKL